MRLFRELLGHDAPRRRDDGARCASGGVRRIRLAHALGSAGQQAIEPAGLYPTQHLIRRRGASDPSRVSAESRTTPYVSFILHDHRVLDLISSDPEIPLPKRNYGFEKRQKELAKRKKREDRLQRRRERNASSDTATTDQADDSSPPDSPAIQP